MGSFKTDYSTIVFTINTPYERSLPTVVGGRPVLLYADFNGDGKKDISYIDSGFGVFAYNNSVLPKKTVFIRTGNQFIEQSFYLFDPYAKSILGKTKISYSKS